VCFLEAPVLNNADASREMTNKLQAAIRTTYQGLANTDETPILILFP